MPPNALASCSGLGVQHAVCSDGPQPLTRPSPPPCTAAPGEPRPDAAPCPVRARPQLQGARHHSRALLHARGPALQRHARQGRQRPHQPDQGDALLREGPDPAAQQGRLPGPHQAHAPLHTGAAAATGLPSLARGSAACIAVLVREIYSCTFSQLCIERPGPPPSSSAPQHPVPSTYPADPLPPASARRTS